MENTIDMKDFMHLKLLSQVAHVETSHCFHYNEAIFFCVPKRLVSKAIGEDARNVKRMKQVTKKRIKILPLPRGIEDAKTFIEAIVAPVTFKNLEIKDNEIIMTAGPQSKAALLGRNKRRLLEMQQIVKNYFKRDFKIV